MTLVGLAPPDYDPSPSNRNIKHSGVLSIFTMLNPLHKRKAPRIENFLATVLFEHCAKTFSDTAPLVHMQPPLGIGRVGAILGINKRLHQNCGNCCLPNLI